MGVTKATGKRVATDIHSVAEARAFLLNDYHQGYFFDNRSFAWYDPSQSVIYKFWDAEWAFCTQECKGDVPIFDVQDFTIWMGPDPST